MKVNMQLVGQVMSRLSPTKTTPRFRVSLPPQQVLDILTEFYICSVDRRHLVPSIDENTQKNLIAVTEALTAENPKFGIWLYGSVGNGKTTMLYAIMRLIELLGNKGYFKYMGQYFYPHVRFKTATEVVALREESKREFNDFIDNSIVAIDDVGNEPKEILEYGNVITPMVELISQRYKVQAYTLVTSNLSPAQIKDKYDERISDRCREMFTTIKFLNSTYRTK
ncbi:MAG: hypothetical protein NC111_06610 [Bacteroides sp.]|nr:hypothetical protein [Bacteroides sp.]MCM1413082.1 hypothetical protein [Bacteroides sp.]MCM1472176.1 hypothetical protein [Bacteroides sp.]